MVTEPLRPPLDILHNSALLLEWTSAPPLTMFEVQIATASFPKGKHLKIKYYVGLLVEEPKLSKPSSDG